MCRRLGKHRHMRIPSMMCPSDRRNAKVPWHPEQSAVRIRYISSQVENRNFGEGCRENDMSSEEAKGMLSSSELRNVLHESGAYGIPIWPDHGLVLTGIPSAPPARMRVAPLQTQPSAHHSLEILVSGSLGLHPPTYLQKRGGRGLV